MFKQKQYNRAQIKARSLGPIVNGVVVPMPATNDSNMLMNGIIKRVGLQTPAVAVFHKRRIREFVRLFLRKNLKPLDKTLDYSVEHWLPQTNYNGKRCEELLAARKDLKEMTQYDLMNKFFGKTEFLETDEKENLKLVRIINSRTDAFKVATGPYFHAIEQAVFKLDRYVKRVPVLDRLAFTKSRLEKEGYAYASTDWSSFEAHMTPEIIDMVEFQLYSYMLKNAPDRTRVLNLIRRALEGKQRCVSKLGMYSILGTRMSGDMCTSLGNGFTNMVLVLYLFDYYHIPCDGVFEGDDGVVAYPARHPALTAV